MFIGYMMIPSCAGILYQNTEGRVKKRKGRGDTPPSPRRDGLLMPIYFNAAEERRTLVDLHFDASSLMAFVAEGDLADQVVGLHVHDVQRAVVAVGAG